MQNRIAPVGTLLRSLRVPILAGFAPARRKPLEIPFRFRQRGHVRGDRPVSCIWIRLQSFVEPRSVHTGGSFDGEIGHGDFARARLLAAVTLI